ncbi:MAG: hypothetical protein ACJAZA_000754 [Shewanella psychromarinicola]|jgi:hypothetical protein
MNTKTKLFSGGWLLLFVLFASVPVFAEEQAPAGTNPTDITNRFDLKYRFIDAQSGAKLNVLTARLDYALTSDLLLRVDVPTLNVDPNVAGFSDKTGLGDLFFRVGWRAVNTPEYAVFLGGDFVLDTASSNILGGGTTKAIPLVAVAAPVPAYKGLIAVVLSHAIDIGGSNRQDVSETEIRTVWTQMLGKGRWYSLDAHFFVDWENDQELGWYQELQLGQMLSPKLGVTLTPGIGITGDNAGVPDWSFEAGVRYFF